LSNNSPKSFAVSLSERIERPAVSDSGAGHGVSSRADRTLWRRSRLESALAQPQTTWCYDSAADLFDLSAAYAFHLGKNHAFRDGNKREALHAALAFLHINGVVIAASQEAMYDAMWQLVTSVIDKKQFAAFLRNHCA
jgi:death-on-curing protein